MAKTKKIILFIVEGPSDKLSLSGILNRLTSDNNVKFYIVGGDVTTVKGVNAANALVQVHKKIKEFIAKEPGIKKSDIVKVVHLVDSDGAFIGDDSIIFNENVRIKYTEQAIFTQNVEDIKKRNAQKREVIKRLYLCKEIGGIAYKMYYFSCNLEHVLHNEIDVDDDLKEDYAYDFDERYIDNPQNFIDFINSDFAVEGDYKGTWKYLMEENNSLSRASNFHLYFSSF